MLQSNQCLRRLNLTFQVSYTFLISPGKSRDCVFAIRLRSARSGLSAHVQRFRHTAAVSGKALLSSSLLQPISILREKIAAEFTDLQLQSRKPFLSLVPRLSVGGAGYEASHTFAASIVSQATLFLSRRRVWLSRLQSVQNMNSKYVTDTHQL